MKISNYLGSILNGNYSQCLHECLESYILNFGSFEDSESPAMIYISAWKEDKNEIIWYEFISKNILKLLKCDYGDVSKIFSENIIHRIVYEHPNDKEDVKKEVISKNQLKDTRNILRKEVKLKGSIDAVYKLLLNDGRVIWLKDNARIESYNEDNICLSIGSLTEVSKEMAAEEELTQIFNTASDGMCVIDINFRIRRINDTFSTFLGMKQGEAKGKYCYDLIKEQFCNTSDCPINKVLCGETKIEYDTNLTKYDGKLVPCIVTANRYMSSNNDLLGIVINFKDITYRKKAEEERIYREKLQGVLETAGAVCHELNQPMQVISGYCELLLISANTNETKTIRIILDKIEQMGKITRKLMNITRYETKEYIHGIKIIDIEKSSDSKMIED
ncbi:MAG: PAS domain S-box protein [Desulfobacterales bacterium]|nr:PAS domain S-box protein [Desulfobacterales bacterium]